MQRMTFQFTRIVGALSAGLLAAPLFAAQPGEVWQPKATEIAPRCETTITDAHREIARLERLPLAAVNKQTVLMAWNRLEIALEDMGDPIHLLSEVSPNPDVRKAAEECVLKL